ncbi:MAG: hypothetical protein KDA96_10005, partial [Planctomycetaceae bacterium]|nr:hypothetical protein [Planctomycetaceae bacterium]
MEGKTCKLAELLRLPHFPLCLLRIPAFTIHSSFKASREVGPGPIRQLGVAFFMRFPACWRSA